MSHGSHLAKVRDAGKAGRYSREGPGRVGSRVAARLLVHERLDVERLHDVGVELRVQVRVADALVQQLAHLRAWQYA